MNKYNKGRFDAITNLCSLPFFKRFDTCLYIILMPKSFIKDWIQRSPELQEKGKR